MEEEIDDFIEKSMDNDQLEAMGWDDWGRTLLQEQVEPELLARMMLAVARRALNWDPGLRIVLDREKG